MTPRRNILIGAGGHAVSLLAMAPEGVRFTGYADPEDNNIPGLEWLGSDEQFLADNCGNLEGYAGVVTYVSGSSCSMAYRSEIIGLYERSGFQFMPAIIAPTAIIAPYTKICRGATVFHRAVINTGAEIGDHSIVNTGAIIEHNVTLGSNVFVGPGAVVCGGAMIGNNVYIGANATILPGMCIVDGVTIGAGSTVIDNIIKPGTYVGSPARKI